VDFLDTLDCEEVFMKTTLFMSCLLATSLAIGAPTVVFAHAGHGNEFQAEGGINRVAVNAETDAMLGIQVNPIAPATDGSAAVRIPVTALVDDNGRQLVFVQYGNFYEPVPIKVGATQGEFVEVTQGLSIGEKLVTQGSLSLYAESRKVQTVTASPSPAPSAGNPASPSPAPSAGNLPSGEAAPQANGFPLGIVAAVGGGVVLLGGALAVLTGNRKKNGTTSNKRGGV
jgi:membrane fusion protein, cation efflux system